MTKEELLQKLTEIEWDDFECKRALDKLPEDVWETVSAFSNTSGGWIVFGINQQGKRFEIQGVNNGEKTESDFLNTLRNGQKFNMRLTAKAKKYNFDGRLVLAFFVPSCIVKPIYAGNPINTYIRTGSGDRRATETEVMAMMRDQAFGSKSEQVVEGTSIGDLNRDINAANSLMATIRNALAALQAWIASLHEKKKIIEEELANLKEPTLSDLLLDYYQIRSRERGDWSSRARLKGTVADYEKISNAAAYLREHKLISLDDLHGHIDLLEGRYHSLSREIRSSQKRMNDIVSIESAFETMRKLQPVKDAWQKKNFRSAKEKYRKEHSEELDSYSKAVRLLMKVNGGTTVDHAALKAESTELASAINTRTNELETVKDELKQLRSIQYYISKVLPEGKAPEKVSISDRLSEGRLQSDRAAGNEPEQPERKQNIEH